VKSKRRNALIGKENSSLKLKIEKANEHFSLNDCDGKNEMPTYYIENPYCEGVDGVNQSLDAQADYATTRPKWKKMQ
jgi:hypothetical protein